LPPLTPSVRHCRQPTKYQGETVLAAISLPPVIAEANRHAPSRSHPGRLAATAPIAVSANRPAPGRGVTACPPRRQAAKDTKGLQFECSVERSAAF
jgi:hypothetical protein